jgi:hypothetical protein
MRSLGTRRVALLAGAATAAAVALTGCSAGQTAETSLKKPSNQGVNTQNATGSVLIRNLSVAYTGPAGYQPGSNAPINVNLYNQTTAPITVTVTSAPPAPGKAAPTGAVVATEIGLSGGTASASATPAASSSASPEPSGSAAAGPQPARITIAGLGSATFMPGDPQTLEAVGLNGKLVPGNSLSLVFTFSDGSPDLPVLAQVAIPLTPAPRASGIPDENTEE